MDTVRLARLGIERRANQPDWTLPAYLWRYRSVTGAWLYTHRYPINVVKLMRRLLPCV